MAKRRLSEQQLKRIRQNQDRRRQRAGERVQAMTDQGLGSEQPGLVITHYGATAVVENTTGELYRCVLRQNLEPLACGDRVVWQPAGPNEGVISALQPRRSVLMRPDYSGRLKPVAANLDQVAVVIAPRPEPNPYLIDRYLVAIHAIGVEALIVLNKTDLLDPPARAALLEELADYPCIGYPLLSASSRTVHGLDELRARLSEHTAILVGQSGVGKSSLIQALLPDREIRVQALSATTGLGTHTTTTSMLYHLPDGGDLIDSPGVRSFDLGEVGLDELEQGFMEFRPYLGRCRFSNCSHSVEPDCALLAAAAAGIISPRRLDSYRQLRASLGGRQI